MNFNPYPIDGLTEEQRKLLQQGMNRPDPRALYEAVHGPTIATLYYCKDTPYAPTVMKPTKYEAHMPMLSSFKSLSPDAIKAIDAFLKLCTVPQTKQAQDALRLVYAAAFASPTLPIQETPMPTVTLTSKIKRNDTRDKLSKPVTFVRSQLPKSTAPLAGMLSNKGLATLRKKAKAQKRLKNGRFAKGAKKAVK